MALPINFSISMPADMAETLDDLADKHDLSRSECVRHLLREAESSPFDQPYTRLSEDESEKGAA
jgi:metal-responsive CopG/Arc/MetJ family transcriptional regulator